MTTRADASEVLTMIQALHWRSAPRLDDDDATIAMLTTWAEAFSVHNLTAADLVAGVKLRAQYEAGAPEVSEIIEFARKVRSQRTDTDEDRERREALAESKGEDAQELSALRAARANSDKVSRPEIMARIRSLGAAKAVPDDAE